MTPKTCREEITSLIRHLVATGAALDINTIVERHASDLKVIEPSGASSWQLAARRDFGDIAEYIDVLYSRRFACLLLDGAAIQMSYAFSGEGLVWHRLCFHPCPITLGQDELDLIGEDIGLGELVDLSLEGDWRTRLRLRSPLRFDFDRRTAMKGHSASHLHVSSGGCRVPVFGPLSVGHFVRIVFRHFYPSLWSDDPTLRGWKLTQLARSIAQSEEGELYIDCKSRDAAKLLRLADYEG
jgi:hypothetical protein